MIKQKKVMIGLILSLVILVAGGCSDSDEGKTQKLKPNSNQNKVAMAAAQQKTNWDAVEQIIGKKGEMKEGDVFYFSLPRTDLQVSVNGIQVKPAFALGSWLGFKEMNGKAMVMGDLVLKQEEVNPVMTELIRGGIEITALHNHLLEDSPHIMYMHIEGHGNPTELAKAIRSGIDKSQTPISNQSQSKAIEQFSLNKEQLDKILGKAGSISSGVYKVSFPRKEVIKENGMIIPPSMGTATSVNFQPTGGERAAITGDFVLTAKEVTPVIQTLRKNDIEVKALHNHMLFDEPHLFFVHYWANDDVVKLAKGIREAIDQTNSK